MKLYTIGYQGLTLTELGIVLHKAGVDRIVDVRDVPWSKQMDFREARLAEFLSQIGIGYEHLKAAGNPLHLREAAPHGPGGLAGFREYLQSRPDLKHAIVSALSRIFAQSFAPCLMCLERSPQACHRSVVIEALGERWPDLHVIHLIPELRGKPASSQPPLFEDDKP